MNNKKKSSIHEDRYCHSAIIITVGCIVLGYVSIPFFDEEDDNIEGFVLLIFICFQAVNYFLYKILHPSKDQK